MAPSISGSFPAPGVRLARGGGWRFWPGRWPPRFPSVRPSSRSPGLAPPVLWWGVLRGGSVWGRRPGAASCSVASPALFLRRRPSPAPFLALFSSVALVWARAGVPSPPSARGWAGARQVASPPAPGRRPSLRFPVLRGGSSSVSPFPPWRVAPEGAAPPSGAWGGGLVSCGAGAGCAALWGRRSRLLAPLVLPPRLLPCVGRWARPRGCGGLWPRGEQGREAEVVHSLSPSGYRRGTNNQPSPVNSMPCNSRMRSRCTRSRI